MNPEALSRDAVRLVDRLEAQQIARLRELTTVIYQDARERLSLLELNDPTVSRAIRQLQVRRVLEGSRASRQLLDLGRNGPLAEAMRADIQRAYVEGLRHAGEAVAAAAPAGDAAATIAAAAAFGSRVDLELVQAITESTLTTLARVGERAMPRLEEALVRVAVRGAGPRAGARVIRDAVDVTRVEAERITRTVLMNANNEARRRGYEQAGVQHVRFDATNDERTCEFCGARHGMVYRLKDSPSLPLHPNCRCVLLPYRENATPEDRGDAYYERTRRELRERDVIETRPTGGSRRSPPSSVRPASTSTATAAAPFERLDGRPAPTPVFRPDGTRYG